MVEEHHLSRVRACRAAELPALYRAPQDETFKDAPVIDAIKEFVQRRPRWWVLEVLPATAR